MHFWNSAQRLISGVAAIGVVTLVTGYAGASENFPTAIQEAAGLDCAPSCTLCHGVDPGTATSFLNRPLGKAMFGQGLAAKDAAGLKANYAKYRMDPANAAAVATLEGGKDPFDQKELCSGLPTYGCGAHVAAKTPPADFTAPLWVVGAMVTAGLLRRRKSSRA